MAIAQPYRLEKLSQVKKGIALKNADPEHNIRPSHFYFSFAVECVF